MSKKIKIHEKRKYHPKKDRSATIIAAAIVSFFVGGFITIFFYSKTLINLYGLSKVIAVCGIAGFLVPLKFYEKKFDFIKYEVILFNLLGIAPLLTGLFLFLNFQFSTSYESNTYKIKNTYYRGNSEYKTLGLVLEKNAFSKNPKVVEFYDSRFPLNSSFASIKITFGDGLFGYKTIQERKLIP